MRKCTSFAAMLATSAFLALPVLAQTTASPGTANGAPGMTPSSTATGTTTSPSSMTGPASTTSTASTTDSAKYFTADHQVRLSKVIGASVYNNQNQSVGSIDDLLMSNDDHKAATAVISVGGFLGMGSKLVSVPFDQLKVEKDKIVMPDATKASLEGMPAYHYSNA